MPGRQRLRRDQYNTYGIRRPAATHWRPATCEDVECANYLRGWSTGIDEGTDLGVRQAQYIRGLSGRSFTEERHPVARLTVFTFAPGQPCFAEHRLPIERESLFVVRRGEAALSRHSGADAWVDDFATNQDRLASYVSKG